MFRLILLALACVLVLTVPAAFADGRRPLPPPPPLPPPGPSLADHNGSLMTLSKLGAGRIEIRYAEPRPGLWEIGVRPGTLLITGRWNGPMFYGTAYIFAYACGPVPYPVSGRAGGDGVLVLRGASPVVDLYSCAVIGTRWDSPNATLVFTPVLPEG